MRLTTGYEYKKARIELIPLLDVVFLLLVFFIYAILSMSVHQGVRVTLPVASGEAQQKTIVRIVLDAKNTLSLDGTPCDMNDCVKRVAERVRRAPSAVLIHGDRQAELGIGIELLSRLRTAGVPSVAFEVQRK